MRSSGKEDEDEEEDGRLFYRADAIAVTLMILHSSRPADSTERDEVDDEVSPRGQVAPIVALIQWRAGYPRRRMIQIEALPRF